MFHARSRRPVFGRLLLAAYISAAVFSLSIRLSGSPPNAVLQVPRLSDITEQSQVRFRHLSGEPFQKNYIFEAKGGGLAFLDFDNDRLMDLLVVQGSTVDAVRSGLTRRSALFRNRGDGRFEDVSDRANLRHRGWGMGATAADYDNDGDTDIYINCLGKNILFRNDGGGTFTDVSSESGTADARWSTSAAFGDYDNDGWLDLYVCNYLEVDWNNLPIPGSNEYCFYKGRSTFCGPLGIPASGDVLYHNNGDGTFTDVTDRAGDIGKARYNGLGVVWSDLDNDADLDLYVANDATPNLLYVNDGRGVFKEQAFVAGVAVSGDARAQSGMGLDAADYDNDGRIDLYVTHFASDYNTLYRNEGNLVFEDVTIAAGIVKPSWLTVGWGVALVDLNHDGWQDIFFANGHVYPFLEGEEYIEQYRQGGTLLLNRHNLTFADESEQAGLRGMPGMVGRGVAFADLDNDGDIDFAIANLNGSPRVVRNDNSGGHWIQFQLVGRKSNRDGIGARLTLSCEQCRQVREARTGRGIYSASDPRVHFGTACEKVDRLEISWPSGTRQAFDNLAVDCFYRVDEDGGLVKLD